MNKNLEKYGVAGIDFTDISTARGYTYTDNLGGFPTTNLACLENPFIEQLNSAKYILDFGCGVGRNLPWIMNHTSAHYVGIDPNKDMLKYFWPVQEAEGHDILHWKDRVNLFSSFDEISSDIKFDYVVSTFVMQHLGYRFSTDKKMNLTDITNQILTMVNDGCIFWLLEHDSEEKWIDRWLEETNIKLDVYIRTYKGLKELTHRDHATTDGNHLMIFKT